MYEIFDILAYKKYETEPNRKYWNFDIFGTYSQYQIEY